MFTYYNIIIFVGTIIIGLLGFAEQIAKQKHWSWFNTLWFKLVLFFFGSFLIAWATINKDIDADKKSQQEREKSERLLAIRDSINKEDINKAWVQFTDIVAKYSYRADSTTNSLRKYIKDSAKKTVISVEDPLIDISNIKIDSLVDNDLYISSEITCLGSNSRNLSYSVGAAFYSNNQYYIYSKLTRHASNFDMHKGSSYTIRLGFTHEKAKAHIVYLYFKGIYYNSNLTKKISFDEIYFYDIKRAKYGKVANSKFKTGLKKAISTMGKEMTPIVDF